MALVAPRSVRFTKSPTVAVVAHQGSRKSGPHYIHTALLEDGSKYFETMLKTRLTQIIPLDLDRDVDVTDFDIFVTWLYKGCIDEHTLGDRFVNIWTLASQLQSDTFKSYIMKEGRVHLQESDYLSIAKFLDGDVISKCALRDYILSGLATKIASNGWVSFIERTRGGWEDFMSHKDNGAGTKGKLISFLMAHLDQMRQNGTQSSPAIQLEGHGRAVFHHPSPQSQHRSQTLPVYVAPMESTPHIPIPNPVSKRKWEAETVQQH
ncbi:hypothetical protein Z517_00337 [Fonsecaea pedrosoi CBS 271.37]|uniref:BTB domain-containing protein n=1 Tax=Fonsecaea pedrosoi CBS 271.37 TaxID=1442368 RepID=A0A0D2HKD6_9EURO|nr:uncharacterized protein Z517_00337 [Fonsecaea pedrosoi CBS 271.37]KIW84949.1 hypothetical protein Z517_00337 [Fonsecaea pedrosoi CBS 271.37]